MSLCTCFKQIHKFFGSREHNAGVRGFDIGNRLLEQTRELGVDVPVCITEEEIEEALCQLHSSR